MLRPVELIKENLELDLYPITTYEQFLRVGDILVERLNARIIDKVDGPDANTWTIEIDGKILKIHHYSSVGNRVTSDCVDGRDVLERIKTLFDEILA